MYKFFGIVLVWGSFVMSGGIAVHGQNTAGQQKNEFEKGNRDAKFLKEYADSLKAKGQMDELENVLDCYLMVLPLGQRYTSDNVQDLIAYVNGIEARSLLDIVENWSKLSLNDKQREAIVEKIDRICPAVVFTWIVGQKENPDLKMPDFTLLQKSLSNSTIPLGKSRRGLMAMWQSYSKKDTPGIIKDMKGLFTSPIEFNEMFDWMMFGYIGNYLLEESNLSQCKEIVSILTKALVDYEKKGDMLTVVKLKEDFEGKSMMLEMGAE